MGVLKRTLQKTLSQDARATQTTDEKNSLFVKKNFVIKKISIPETHPEVLGQNWGPPLPQNPEHQTQKHYYLLLFFIPRLEKKNWYSLCERLVSLGIMPPTS